MRRPKRASRVNREAHESLVALRDQFERDSSTVASRRASTVKTLEIAALIRDAGKIKAALVGLSQDLPSSEAGYWAEATVRDADGILDWVTFARSVPEMVALDEAVSMARDVGGELLRNFDKILSIMPALVALQECLERQNQGVLVRLRPQPKEVRRAFWARAALGWGVAVPAVSLLYAIMVPPDWGGFYSLLLAPSGVPELPAFLLGWLVFFPAMYVAARVAVSPHNLLALREEAERDLLGRAVESAARAARWGEPSPH